MARFQQVATLLYSPFKRFGQIYSSAAEKRPFTVGVVTTGIKTSAADLFAQFVMERRSLEEFDTTRHTAFCIFGFAYLGGFQYVLYTKVLRWVTSPITSTMGHIGSAPVKTLLDQAIHHPFMYFPAFYYLKYTLVGGESSEIAMERYWDELWPNCNALWRIWVPAQLVNFSVVPPHLQIPFAAGVSFVWTVILSMMRGSDTGKATNTDTHDEEAAAAVEVAPPTHTSDDSDESNACLPKHHSQAVPPAAGAATEARIQPRPDSALDSASHAAPLASGNLGYAVAAMEQSPAPLAAAACVFESPQVEEWDPSRPMASVAEPLAGLTSALWLDAALGSALRDATSAGTGAGAATGRGVAAEWAGTAGLLHLKHPLLGC